MKPLAIFTQKDVFPEQEEQKNITYEDRPTGKAIIFNNENKVALVGNQVNSFYLLPGGGIDEGETIENGIIRECLEETGYLVKLLNKIGTTEDYRAREKKHYINYCYTAKLIGEKGKVQLTEDEEKRGLHVVWVSMDEAIKTLGKEMELLKRGKVKFYNTGFDILRDHLFLCKAYQVILK